MKSNDGFRKEYNNLGNLIFEGEYLNGKRNGKGKEYNMFGELIFEGEYLNGNKWEGIGYDGYPDETDAVYELKGGKGIVKYYYKDDLIFKGEYLNGA